MTVGDEGPFLKLRESEAMEPNKAPLVNQPRERAVWWEATRVLGMFLLT